MKKLMNILLNLVLAFILAPIGIGIGILIIIKTIQLVAPLLGISLLSIVGSVLGVPLP